MFEDLYNAISFLGSSYWPKAEGKVTAVNVERIGNRQDRLRLAVAYEFYACNDGPYTGESFWKPAFFVNSRVLGARRNIRRGQSVKVRYRKDNPSVNRLDGSAWGALANGNSRLLMERRSGVPRKQLRAFQLRSADAAIFAFYFGIVFVACRFDIRKHGTSFQHPMPSAKSACIGLAVAVVLTAWFKIKDYIW